MTFPEPPGVGFEAATTFVPKNNGDFPVVADLDIHRGWKVVKTLAGRDGLTVAKSPEGTFCFVADELKIYRRDNLDQWVLAIDLQALGGGPGGGHGTLGTPTDGSFADGAIALTVGMQADDAIDQINEFLGAIAPTQPGDLTGQVLTLSGTTLYGAKLPSGLAAAWSPYTPGATILNLAVDGTYNLAAPAASQRFNDGQTSTTPGDVAHVLNGSDHEVRDIALGAGTTGDLEITDVATFNSIWRKVNARIVFNHAATLTEGRALHAMRHDPDTGPSDQSADTEVFFDDVNAAPAFSVAPGAAVPVEQLRPLSGIDYYREGTQFDVSYTAASGIFQKAYHPTAVAVVGCPSAANVNRNPGAVPAVLDTFADTAPLTLLSSNVADNSPTADVTLQKPNGVTTQQSAALARGINTYEFGASTLTRDDFVDELLRLVLGTGTAWTSSAALVDGNAQVQNGQLVHGANGDYGAHTSDAAYERRMTPGVISGGTIDLDGVAASTIAPVGTGTFNVLLQLETEGVWFDLGTLFGVNNGDGTGSSPANSKGAKIGASGGDLSFSFGTFSTGNNSNQFRLRIVFVGINGLALTGVEVS